MALSKIFGKKDNTLKVKSYSISQAEVLGKGAFGIVYKGRDAKKSTVAAKRIDGNDHPQILIQDLNRLMKLDHPNVMNIMDVEKTENYVWMFLPFCEQGDLNMFFRTRYVSDKIEIMKQIMSGISYLHSKDIVHRDIKPGNIMVSSITPLIVQLADFDISKCLDPEVETSLMTSNVGTLAFKAPEFFQRTSDGKVEYHRNVDIYAAGLTFLAILQAEKGKKMLIPRIETPMEDSEFHAPSIGQLVAERIKYKIPELNIVQVRGSVTKVISQMTCVKPEERLSATDVLDVLHDSETQEIKLVRGQSFPVKGTMDVTAKDLLLVRMTVRSKYYIRVLDRQTGDLVNQIPSMCNHIGSFVKKHPWRADCVLECCPTCQVIRGYNINTSERCTVYEGPESIIICNGPGGSPLAVDGHNGLFELEWNDDGSLEAKAIYQGNVPTQKLNKRFLLFSYAEHHDILLCTVRDQDYDKDYEILAVNFESDNLMWRMSDPVDGRVIKPESIACDSEDNVHVNDQASNRILQINVLTGEVLRILLLDEDEENDRIISIRWSKRKPNLTIRTSKQISTYFVPK